MTNKMPEHTFNMLEIDLTQEKTDITDVTQDFKKYLGGRGFGAKLLWEKVPQGADPLGPDNILYLGIGPMTTWLGGSTVASFKSPLTMLVGRSSTTGRLSREIMYSGYNGGILIKGRASSPVYIYIKDEQVEIRDASRLWGSLVLKTQHLLTEELAKSQGGHDTVVACIGPAGERLVRNASINHEFIHSMARLGCGAVMGSKMLKAVAIAGTKGPSCKDPEKAYSLFLQYTRSESGLMRRMRERRWGHNVSMPERYYKTTEGVKNKQLGWHAICDLSNPLLLEQKYKVWTDGCYICTSPCKVPYFKPEPPLGPVVGELRHDNGGGFNANIMVKGYDEQIYISPLCEELGLDAEDVSGVVAWMMECYEKGIVSKDEIEVELTWGNVTGVCELLKKIAYREGLGNILAEGLRLAPGKIGRGSEHYAMHSKGVAITSYEPRGNIVEAVDLATSSVGAVHGGRGTSDSVLRDSATFCSFNRESLSKVFGSVQKGVAAFTNAATGWGITEEDVKTVTQRGYYLERCFSLREAHYLPVRDDTLPERFFTETIYNKYGKPFILDRGEFSELRKLYYKKEGLSDEGLPTKDTLGQLGLDFTIPVLEDMGLVA